MKHLKHYAAYYINCPCLNTWFTPEHDAYNAGWKLQGFRADNERCYMLGNETEVTWTDSIKLVLRRLEDMTEEEAIELVSQVVHKDEFINVSTYRHNFTNDLMVQWGLLTPMERANDVEYYFNATGERSWSSAQTHYLLQHHFDLFGLIDDELAVDAKSVEL